MEQTKKNGEAVSANKGSMARYSGQQERLSYNDELEGSDNAVRGLRNRYPPQSAHYVSICYYLITG